MPCRPLSGALLDSKARRYIAGKADLSSASTLQNGVIKYRPCDLPMEMKFDDSIFGCDVAYCRGRGQWIISVGKAPAQ